MTASLIEKQRQTKETTIQLSVDFLPDPTCQPKVKISTGLPFFNHMLEQLAFHAGWQLILKAQGDLDVDDHHLIEDTALVLGAAIEEFWRQQKGCQRYGQRYLPMDEALVLCAVDLSGRPHAHINLHFSREFIGGINSEMWSHFFHSLAMAAHMSLHIRQDAGHNHHHIIEAAFKALAYALKEAFTPKLHITSTKGTL